ncbi:MAG: hypothetical protein FJ161_01920 [Gammaproteobacteria bacterium]|nr:hypothetical protein [Gammaproteobacteria bacterium]
MTAGQYQIYFDLLVKLLKLESTGARNSCINTENVFVTWAQTQQSVCGEKELRSFYPKIKTFLSETSQRLRFAHCLS